MFRVYTDNGLQSRGFTVVTDARDLSCDILVYLLSVCQFKQQVLCDIVIEYVICSLNYTYLTLYIYHCYMSHVA